MSLEELWELFPISLEEPSETWAQRYQRIEAVLTGALENVCGLRVSHIGSTAIAGIMAKDVVGQRGRVMLSHSAISLMLPLSPSPRYSLRHQ